ncbi:MAG TPA: phosphodiester glycosidase family protein [Pyrinomonadaceae bacterium]|jgi:uncharacterized protein YigE (DUF2233 family)
MLHTVDKKRRGRARGMKSGLFNAKWVLILSLMFLFACRNSPSSNEAPRHLDTKCRPYAAEGIEVSCLTQKQVGYTVIRVNLKAASIKMMWKNAAGVPYGSLSEAYRQFGDDLLAVTNAGIYGENKTPAGLHIEGGMTQHPLNLDNGEGNFYWKPNGVFYVADDGAGIMESERFNSLDKRAGVTEATQSGPLLVSEGAVNSKLPAESKSLYVRNGIGIKSADEVYILISEDEVSLYDFADVFVSQLHCRNALYLDGCVSQLYLPVHDSYIPGQRRCEKELVGLLGVVKRK